MQTHYTHWLKLCSIFLLLTVSATTSAAWHKKEQAIMGTLIRVELWHEDEGTARRAIASVMDEMHRIDQLMSPYKKTSGLTQINNEAPHKAVRVEKELFDLIARSLHFSRLTNGAFDITFASVGRLYDYRKKIHPSDKSINQNLKRIDYHHIILDKKVGTIRFAIPGVSIDLGGIAKGYAVDTSTALLKKAGIKYAIITAGGDSRIIGDRRGRPWMIGIRDPRKSRAVKGMIPLVRSALSTSGDYERYFVENGEHFHHILRPDTGKSARQLRSVTVIGPDATTTDALSTSVFVLGPEKGMALIESLEGIEAVLIDQQDRLIYSSGMQARQNNTKKQE